MLCRLSITNLILVKSCQIEFHEGFTILTGESGAGKSVIASAITFLMGSKVDASQIRKSSSQATVEGTFYPVGDKIIALLQESGITHDPNEELIILRELHDTGKSKSYVNNRAVTASFLKKMAPHLVSYCSQHASLELFDPEYCLELLDRFAEASVTKKAFQKVFAERSAVEKKIEELTLSKQDRLSLFTSATSQIEEIEKLELNAGVDAALYERFCSLTNSQELSHLSCEIVKQLDNFPIGRLRPLFEKLVTYNSEKKPLLENFNAVAIELKELTYELSRCQHTPEEVQEELQSIQARLSLIDAIKRKFGKTIEEVLAFKLEREALLKKIDDQELELVELKVTKARLQEEENSLANQLSNVRKQFAPELSDRITKELQSLNMPSCLFELALEPCNRGHHGDEKLFCYIQVNKGLSRALVTEAASGGELSRIILAFKTVFVSDEDNACLIFDEIDANIGGQTASIVGEKLSKLSFGRQVLAITHFPQVAHHASHHFFLCKKEENNTTVTTIQQLTTKLERDEEYNRMWGLVKV